MEQHGSTPLCLEINFNALLRTYDDHILENPGHSQPMTLQM
jgi:hypothetical protein